MASNLNPITPTVWEQTLQQAVDSRHGRQPHQYIVRDSNGTLSVTANPRTDQQKLTIRDIIEETKASLRESAQKKQFLEEPSIVDVANNIKACTKELIDARAEKGIHNSPRMIAKFFSALGCLALIGIPFFRALLKGDREFKAQAAALKAEIDNPNPAASEVLKLRHDYTRVEMGLAGQREMLEFIRSNEANNPKRLKELVDDQQSRIDRSEAELESIRKRLAEHGELPPK